MDEATGGTEAPVYAFRPRMVGGEVAFRLGADSLEWFSGSYSGRVAYPMIRRLRLGFRPTTFMGRRFIAEIFPRKGGRLEIASLSARSLAGSADQGPAYRAFVTELHRRVVRAGADCRFEAGMAAWRWWPAAAVSAVLGAGVLFVIARALLAGEFTTGAMMAALGAVLVWQMGQVLLRNRPRTYAPDAIPAEVLP